MDFPVGYADMKPEELHGCQGSYKRLTGTTLTPLSCHWPLPEDAEQTSLGQGWREAGGVLSQWIYHCY